MANRAKKTEHAGAKHGAGAYWGPKAHAKRESAKLRRRSWRPEAARAEVEAADERREAAAMGACSSWPDCEVCG